MGESEWEEKLGGEDLHPDAGHAQTRATHPSRSHAPHSHPPARANAARNSAPRERLSPPGAVTEVGGLNVEVSSRPRPPPLHACVPATHSCPTRTEFPGSLPAAQQTPQAQPQPQESLGDEVGLGDSQRFKVFAAGNQTRTRSPTWEAFGVEPREEKAVAVTVVCCCLWFIKQLRNGLFGI